MQPISLSHWESRALRPGEGPPRPLLRAALPQVGGDFESRNFETRE